MNNNKSIGEISPWTLEEKSPDIVEVAVKQRHLYLLEKVKQGKQLTPKEITELGQLEKKKTKKQSAKDKRGVGRPPKFKTPKEMEVAIDEYFKDNEKPTICGLALALGFLDRHSILDYQAKTAFTATIKKARLRAQNTYEEKLHGAKCTGSIFALKQFGWHGDDFPSGGEQERGPKRVKYSIKPPKDKKRKSQKAS